MRLAFGLVNKEAQVMYMKKELADQFNQEVDGYRNALLYRARKCDWDAFRVKAGKLFDYVEAIEFAELERRFFSIFWMVLAVLILALIALFNIDAGVSEELRRLRNMVILASLAGSGFELYFYLDFKIYMKSKMRYFKRRRERFIMNIEKDFREFTAAPAGLAA